MHAVYRVWYGPGDTRVVRSLADWRALGDGIQGAIEYLEPPYRNIVHGADWYLFDDGEMSRGPGGTPGAWANRPDRGHPKRSGPSLPDDEWERLHAEMMQADEWP